MIINITNNVISSPISIDLLLAARSQTSQVLSFSSAIDAKPWKETGLRLVSPFIRLANPHRQRLSTFAPSAINLSPRVEYPLGVFATPFNLTFWTVNSRDRHFRYCGRHTRNRPRSCQACNAAKAKCSFEVDCSRCTKRGIECVYDTMITGGQRASPRSVSAAHTVMVEPCKRPSSLPTSGSSCAVDGISPDGHFAFADNLDINDAQLQPISGTNWQPVDLTSGELFAFEDETFNQYQLSASVSLSLQQGLDQQSGSWCAWMRGNVSLAVVTENPLARSHSNLSAVFLSGRPHAQHNAELIIQSLRSFPTMMLRRETFPWFIHPQSQLVLGSRDAALPEALSNCMSIAQMFASRTFETKNFLRQTIKAEYCRFTFEVRFPFMPCTYNANS